MNINNKNNQKDVDTEFILVNCLTGQVNNCKPVPIGDGSFGFGIIINNYDIDYKPISIEESFEKISKSLKNIF